MPKTQPVSPLPKPRPRLPLLAVTLVGCLPSGALAQVVANPNAGDAQILLGLSGQYRSSYGHELTVAGAADGVVRVLSDDERMVIQLHADGTLRGNYALVDPTDRKEHFGSVAVKLDGAPRLLSGSLINRTENGAEFGWTACRTSDPRIKARFSGVDLWLSPQSVNVSGGKTVVFLNVQNVGPTRTLASAPVTLRLQDSQGAAEAVGQLYSGGALPAATRMSPCQDFVIGFTFDRRVEGEAKVSLTANGLTRLAWLVRPRSASGEFQDANPADPWVPPSAPTSPATDNGTTSPQPDLPAPSPDPAPGNPAPAPGGSKPAPTPASGGFKQLAKWDVRLDRIDMPRDDELVHVYLTFRNATRGVLWQTQGVQVRLGSDDGVNEQNGQSLRSVEGPPQLFDRAPAVDPTDELRAKFVFSRRSGASPSRVTVIEGDKRAEFGAGI